MIIENENQPKVSIICLTYNHEKYIRQCLEGFVSQKTSFPFEVIVHDDASTDNTATIIREYEIKYPNIIKPILQTENQHSKKVGIFRNFVIPKVKGKLVALCEGDDYWCSPNKLQKQVDALENHQECKFCVHRVNLVKENGEAIASSLPYTKMKTGTLNPKEFFRFHYLYGYLFQTSSYLMAYEIYYNFIINPPDFKRICMVGDVPIQYYFISFGNIYYIDEPMSCYRRFSIGSWTSKLRDDNRKRLSVLSNRIETLYEYDKFTKEIYHDEVKRLIDKYSFFIALSQHDYKKCFSSEYKSVFHQFCSLRERISLQLRYYFPRIANVLQLCRKIIYSRRHK